MRTLKKKQYPLYLTAKQKEGLDTLYQRFLDEYDGDITYQAFLRNLLFKGFKYYKIKYGLDEEGTQEDKQEGEAKEIDSDFDIDKIVGGTI